MKVYGLIGKKLDHSFSLKFLMKNLKRKKYLTLFIKTLKSIT